MRAPGASPQPPKPYTKTGRKRGLAAPANRPLLRWLQEEPAPVGFTSATMLFDITIIAPYAGRVILLLCWRWQLLRSSSLPQPSGGLHHQSYRFFGLIGSLGIHCRSVCRQPSREPRLPVMRNRNILRHSCHGGLREYLSAPHFGRQRHRDYRKPPFRQADKPTRGEAKPAFKAESKRTLP
jgi:hypothetical protein